MTPWGLAIIEIIAARDDIFQELQRGVPMKQIHDALVHAGRVTVTYNSFRRQIKPIRDEIKSTLVNRTSMNTGPGTVGRKPVVQVQPARRSHSSNKPSGKFQFDPSRKTEDFF